MARVIEKTVYQFDELSDTAKEKARDWWRSCIDTNDFDFTIEDTVRMGNMMGIEFDTHPVKLYGGGIRHDPNIWWSLSYSQGDGACFEGSYRYNPGALQALLKEAPASWKDRETGEVHENKSNKELHRIARVLQKAQKPYFYKLRATVTQLRNYYHVNVDVYHEDDEYREVSTADDIEQALRDFCDWIYDQLRAEDEYLNSDEQADESIRANEYEFYEDGEGV